VDASHRHYVTVAHGKFHTSVILSDIFFCFSRPSKTKLKDFEHSFVLAFSNVVISSFAV